MTAGAAPCSAAPAGGVVVWSALGGCRWFNRLASDGGFLADPSTDRDLAVRAFFSHEGVDTRFVVGFPTGDRWVEYTCHAQFRCRAHGVFLVTIQQVQGAVAQIVHFTGLFVGQSAFTLDAVDG